MTIREYVAADCPVLARLFYDTVHTVNAADYNREQLNAWANGSVDLEQWNLSFSEHITVVAEKDERIVGFGDISRSGYLDRLYVHKDYQRRGIATAICDRLECSVCVPCIETHASVTALPFFQKRGYLLVKQQQVIRSGVVLTNFVMRKDLQVLP